MWNGSVMLCETEWVTDCDNQDLLASQDLIGRKVAYGWSHVGFICTFWMKETITGILCSITVTAMIWCNACWPQPQWAFRKFK